MVDGAEVLLRTLAANGVTHCFANPGTSELPLVAALDRVGGLRGVLCLFEGVCSGGADGYARMTGHPAATLLHLGPGLANGLANFHNARKARSPIVSIVGQHTTRHLGYEAPLTADIEAFARPVSSWVRTPESAAQIGPLAAEAFAAARSGQVATFILPADFAGSPGGELGPVLPPAPAAPAPGQFTLPPAPAGLFLGGSAARGRTLEAAGRIAAATGMPVFVDRFTPRTERGRGRFAPTRLPYFPEPAQAALAGLRRLVLVDAVPPVSFFGYPGARSELAPEGCKMLPMPAAALEALAQRYPPAPGSRLAAPTPPDSGSLTLDAIGRAIAALLPEDAILSDEMVSSGEPVSAYMAAAAPHDHLAVTGGAIGQGLPVALGAALACPGRKVVALEADGSGAYTPQALWTMARHSLDVVTVIFANRRYRILELELQRAGTPVGGEARAMLDLEGLDWTSIARGFGVPAVRATTAGEFTRAFRIAMAEPGPRLIEAALAGSL